MSCLRVTLIDVGWGDSLLLESQDSLDNWFYALIDSNDSVNSQSSHIFLKRFFERQQAVTGTAKPQHRFEWVLLTHAHADHGQGLKRTLKDFGTRRLWYPDPLHKPVFYTDLVRFAGRSNRVLHHQLVDNSHRLPKLGDATVDILWPPPAFLPANENDNSVVLSLTLDNVTFVLTGDAEAEGVWTKGALQIRKTTAVFKGPHHGADNGMFDAARQTPWLNQLKSTCRVGISSHVVPHPHPDPLVVQELDSRGFKTYRTDLHYHVTFETDGTSTSVRYSHV